MKTRTRILKNTIYHHHQTQQSRASSTTTNWFRQPIPPYRRINDPILFPTHQNQQQQQQQQQQARQHQQPIQYSACPTSDPAGPPKLSRAIASLHNAALVYLHRGLAIHSSQHHPIIHHPSSTNNQEPFLSAVIKGFNQILLLETGLEHSQSREVMEILMRIVRQKLSSSLDQQDHQIWNASKQVIIHSALRPRMSSVGEWAWEEIGRGNYARLIQVWTGILEIVDRRHGKLVPDGLPTTIGLDQAFFSALVVVSSTLSNGPSLSVLVKSLVDRIWSRVIPADQLKLDKLPQPDRARYFLRAVELGLLWRRPVEDEQEHSDGLVEQDERIVHLIRREFLTQQPQSLQYCHDLSSRIQEAVDGTGHEPGWLTVDWSQPPPQTEEKKSPSNIKRDIVLTQKVIGTLFNGFAENGMIDQVEQLIKFSRKLGGMSRYLWSALLRGLNKFNNKSQAGLWMKEFVGRMESEDNLDLDFNMRCILISGSIATDLDGALDSLDKLLLSTTKASSSKKSEKLLPIDAINSIISALLRHKMIERAESLLSQLSDRLEVNTTTLNHFLNYYSKLQYPELDQVLKTLKSFEDKLVKPDVVSFTILLNVLMKLGSGKETINQLLKMMESVGIQPNAITYGSIIHHLCRTGTVDDVQVALKLLDEIEQRGIATTDITYTALIQGFLRAHIQEYESTNAGFQTNNNSQTNHLSTSTKQPESRPQTKLEIATDLIGRLKNRGGRLNQVIYNSLLNALFSTGQFDSGLQVFKLMKSELKSNPNGTGGFELYGNGWIDSYGIIFRRLIQFGNLDLFHIIYFHHFKFEMFTFVPNWIEKLIDRFEKSRSF
ncbi:hypothetical protein MJO29_006078 [Puccinia striiformis f. sp. tritici]|nr:hypothetical protein MJO29_006078 [Puccinia striiformis f. sp. tritici]